MSSDDIESLRGEHVPGPDGYRFGSIDRDRGHGARLQIVDSDGSEIGWAAGSTMHEIIGDAKRKTAAHAADRS